MRYVKYDGADEAQAARLEMCEDALLALILPNRPETDAQVAAFSRAVYAQLEQEDAVPEGVTGFRMGSFSVSLDGARRAACPRARAILQNAGLMCRSVKAC